MSKYYDRTPDGSYHLSMTPRVQVDAMNNPIGDQMGTTRSRDNHEYKTFLRVGELFNQSLPHLRPRTCAGKRTPTPLKNFNSADCSFYCHIVYTKNALYDYF